MNKVKLTETEKSFANVSNGYRYKILNLHFFPITGLSGTTTTTTMTFAICQFVRYFLWTRYFWDHKFSIFLQISKFSSQVDQSQAYKKYQKFTKKFEKLRNSFITLRKIYGTSRPCFWLSNQFWANIESLLILNRDTRSKFFNFLFSDSKGKNLTQYTHPP